MAPSTRPDILIFMYVTDILRLLDRAGGRGFERSDSHIELWRAGAGVDTVEDDDAGV